jgi:hypothetical protein
MVTNETNSLTSGEGKMQLSTCMIEMKDDKIVILSQIKCIIFAIDLIKIN